MRVDFAQRHQSIELAQPQRGRHHIAAVDCVNLFHETDFEEKRMVVSDEASRDVEEQFDVHPFGEVGTLVDLGVAMVVQSMIV